MLPYFTCLWQARHNYVRSRDVTCVIRRQLSPEWHHVTLVTSRDLVNSPNISHLTRFTWCDMRDVTSLRRQFLKCRLSYITSRMSHHVTRPMLAYYLPVMSVTLCHKSVMLCHALSHHKEGEFVTHSPALWLFGHRGSAVTLPLLTCQGLVRFLGSERGPLGFWACAHAQIFSLISIISLICSGCSLSFLSHVHHKLNKSCKIMEIFGWVPKPKSWGVFSWA